MNLKTLVLCVATWLTLGACSRVSVSQTGPQYPPNPPGCEIKWENAAHDQLSMTYDAVGMVTFTGSSKAADLDDEKRERLRVEACKLGGNAVSSNSSTTSGAAMGMAQYFVWRAKE